MTRIVNKQYRSHGRVGPEGTPPYGEAAHSVGSMMGDGAGGLASSAAGNHLQRAWKRAMDITIAGIGLAILWPLFALLALAVKVTSPGPTFYTWPVVGLGGRHFISYKFRTMVANADELKEELLHQNEMTGPMFKMKIDPRVTGVGRIMRKFSLDELPQLWSVFKGDMSLVGPRPPLQKEYALFTPWQKQKLLVKPGITCLWQVSGRNEIHDFDEWIRLDLTYIRDWSLGLDIKILLKTIPAVFRTRGAS
jgi:lipopolysaccharide/colanic/teichoic acid biosynthesis glycosyltransferase